MFELKTELTEKDIASISELFGTIRTGSVFQHPKWPTSIRSDQRIVFLTKTENGNITLSVKIIESKLRRAPSVRYALVQGCPISDDPVEVAASIAHLYTYYETERFAELTVRLDSSLHFAEHVERLMRKEGLQIEPFRPSEFRSTLVLKLDKDMDAIESDFSTNLKRNIKKGINGNIQVRRIRSVDEFAPFPDIFAKMEKERGVVLHNTEFLFQLFSFIEETGLGFFLGTYDQAGTMIGGMILIDQRDRLEYYIGATDPDHRTQPQSHLTFLEAIRLAKSKDYDLFDFGGYGFNAKEGEQVFNINRFKLSFTKDILFFPKPFSFVTSKRHYILGKTLMTIKQLTGKG